MKSCNEEVYKNGEVVAVTSMPKEAAESLCKAQTRITGRLHDWHYSGGRVVIKALPLVVEPWNGFDPAGSKPTTSPVMTVTRDGNTFKTVTDESVLMGLPEGVHHAYFRPAGLGMFCTVARTELKEKCPDVSDEVLSYLNYAIQQAYRLGAPTETPEAVKRLVSAAEQVLADYRCGIDQIEFEDEANESRELADDLEQALKEVSK